MTKDFKTLGNPVLDQKESIRLQLQRFPAGGNIVLVVILITRNKTSDANIANFV